MQNAIDFATVAAKLIPNINVIPVMQKDIDKTALNWSLAKDIPGINQAHIVKCADNHICLFTSQRNLNNPIQELCYCDSSEQCSKSTKVSEQTLPEKIHLVLLF